MKASEFGCGMAHELAITCAKAGWELADFTTLAQNEQLCGTVLGVIRNGGSPNVHDDAEAQLASWKAFYTKYFGVEVDTTGIKIPVHVIGFDRLIVVPKGLTMNTVVKAMRKQFKVYLYMEDLDAEVSKNDRDSRNNGTYAIWCRDRVEADEENKNLSADDLTKQGAKGITLLERLLYELKYFTETGKHLDEQNWTLCSGSRYADGLVPCVYWYPDFRRVGVYWYHPDSRLDDFRARAAVSL